MTSRADLVRWIEQRRAAARREADEQRERGPNVEQSIAQGLALIALAGRQFGWPVPDDPFSEAQDLEAYRRWARLKRAYRATHGR